MSDTIAEPEVTTPTEDNSSHLEDIFNQGNVSDPEPNAESTEAEEVVEATETQELSPEIESLQKQLRDAQSFIGRQSNDIGQLKQQLESLPKEPADPNKFIDEFAERPQETLVNTIEQELAKREQAKAAQQQASQQMRQVVLGLDPEFEGKFDGIKGWYKEKGASEDFVNALTPQHLYQNVDLAVALGEIQKYKQMYEQATQKSGRVIEKLNRGGSTINSRASGTSTSASTDDPLPYGSDVTRYSDAQLREALQKAQLST